MIKKGKGTENVDVFIRCSLFTKINRVTRRLVCQQFLKLYRAKQVYYWAIQRFKLHEHKRQRINCSLGMHAPRIEFQNIMIEESREAKLRSCPQRSSILLQYRSSEGKANTPLWSVQQWCSFLCASALQRNNWIHQRKQLLG